MGQVCQGRQERHRLFVCTETCGKIPFLSERLAGSSRAPLPLPLSSVAGCHFVCLSCRLALGSLEKMVIKRWVASAKSSKAVTGTDG